MTSIDTSARIRDIRGYPSSFPELRNFAADRKSGGPFPRKSFMTQHHVNMRPVSSSRPLAAFSAVCLALAGLFASAGELPENKNTAADSKPDAMQSVDKDHAAKMAQGLVLFK